MRILSFSLCGMGNGTCSLIRILKLLRVLLRKNWEMGLCEND
jgi:hypothetical protein